MFAWGLGVAGEYAAGSYMKMQGAEKRRACKEWRERVLSPSMVEGKAGLG
jgi:hypothetical protein